MSGRAVRPTRKVAARRRQPDHKPGDNAHPEGEWLSMHRSFFSRDARLSKARAVRDGFRGGAR